MKNIIWLTLLFTFVTVSLNAQNTNSKKSASKDLISNFEGSWSCQGAFTKDGRPLEADIEATPILDGKALKYEHEDRPPNSFHGVGLWSLDALSNTLTYTSVFTSRDTTATYSNLFVGKLIDESTISFTADTLVAPPYLKHRYIYQLRAEDRFKFQWQVYSDDEWHTHDYLNCKRHS